MIAAADAGDPRHTLAVELLERADLDPIAPAFVAAEAAYLIGARLGARAEARFLAGLGGFPLEAPTAADCARMAELAEQYAGFPLGGADASVIALAERLDTSCVITFDRGHFPGVRPRHCDALELLPE